MVYLIFIFIAYFVICNALVIRSVKKDAKQANTTFYQIWRSSDTYVLSTIMYPIAAIAALLSKER